MANITLPDGTMLPEYALETTQQEVMKLLMAQVSANKKEFALYEKLVKNSAEQLKDNEKREEYQKEQADTLKDIHKDAKQGKSVFGASMIDAGAAANKLANSFIKLSVMAVGTAITGFGLLGKNALNLGGVIADLSEKGMGLDGVGDSTASTIASFNRLGLTTTEASDLMAKSSSTIAAIGQDSFLGVSQALAQATASGAKFGLNMNQLAEIAADDLEIRQKLGILDNLNAAQAAQRSAELYDSQMNAAKLLGKSIDDIRGASRQTLEENAEFALRVQSIGARLGDDVARGFTLTMEKGLGNLAASGLSQSLIDGIGNEIGAAVAFAGESGQELFRTLNYVNPELVKSVKNMNAMAKSNDPKVVAKVGEEMANFQATLLETAANMDSEDFDNLSSQLLAGSMGTAGVEFAKSLGELRIAAKKYGTTTAAEMNKLAEGAKQYDNAMAKFSGGISGLFNDMSGALGPALAGFATAFSTTMAALPEGAKNAKTYIDDSGAMIREYTDASGKLIKENVTDQMGITDVFKTVMGDISKQITEMFGDAEGGFTNLGDMLRQKVVPVIISFGQWFKDGGAKTIIDTFKLLGSVIAGVTRPFVAIAKAMTGDFAGAGETLAKSFTSLGGVIGTAIVGFVAFNKLLSAGKGVKSFFGKLGFGGGGNAASDTAGGQAGNAAAKGAGSFGKSIADIGKNLGKALKSLGKGLGDAVAGIADGIGKAAKSIGTGLGKAFGAILQGLAKGLTAFANPAILIGAGILGAAIVAIGAGIAGASWILGKALPTLAEGLRSFSDIDGMNLIKVGGGMAALGVGIAAFGAGSVVGALGNIVGGLLDSMNEFFGGTSIFDKVEEFGKYEFPKDRIENNAQALVAYAKAMAAAGGGAGAGGAGNLIGSIGEGLVKLFGGDTLLEKVQKFGEATINKDGIIKNAEAITAYGAAMGQLGAVDYPGATIGALLSDIGSGIVGLFGGDTPLEKMAEFGATNINAAGVMANSNAILAYALAMGELQHVNLDNLESATEDLMSDSSLKAFERLKEFGGLDIGAGGIVKNAAAINLYADALRNMTDLNPDNLLSISDAMAEINRNLISSASTNVTVTNDVGAVNGPSPLPPTPDPEDVNSVEGVNPQVNTSKDVGPPKPSSGGNASLADLIKKTNQKLDQLITINNKQL